MMGSGAGWVLVRSSSPSVGRVWPNTTSPATVCLNMLISVCMIIQASILEIASYYWLNKKDASNRHLRSCGGRFLTVTLALVRCPCPMQGEPRRVLLLWAKHPLTCRCCMQGRLPSSDLRRRRYFRLRRPARRDLVRAACTRGCRAKTLLPTDSLNNGCSLEAGASIKGQVPGGCVRFR